MNFVCQEILYNKKGNSLQNTCKVSPYMEENLSQLIRRRLKELKLTKASLAEQVGVSRSYIGDLANQTAKTQSGFYRPGPEILERLAKTLKVEQSEILNSLGYMSDEFETLKIPEEIQIVGFDGLNQSDIEEIAKFIRYKKAQRHMAEHPEIKLLDLETLERGGFFDSRKEKEKEKEKEKDPDNKKTSSNDEVKK